MPDPVVIPSADRRAVHPARVAGRAASLEEALEAGAELLLRARLPLVCGLVETTVEAQRESILIAELLGGAIDPATSGGHGASILAFQRIGRLGATLGEVRRRADLLVFWGVDPEKAYPDFVDRYLAPTPDSPVRRCIAVDVGEARGPEAADDRVGVPSDREFEVLWALRALVRGDDVEDSILDGYGCDPASLRALAARLVDCRYGVVFHDGDPRAGRGDPGKSVALGSMVMDADRRTRVRLVAIRRPGNPVGAENVLTWQTGYPFAVHFGRGYPRFGPGEFTAEALLSRGEADAVLYVGTDPARDLSPAALDGFRRVPAVVVGPALDGEWGDAEVVIPTAPYGSLVGSIYRMDGVALRRGGRQPGSVPDDAGVLARLARLLRSRIRLGRE